MKNLLPISLLLLGLTLPGCAWTHRLAPSQKKSPPPAAPPLLAANPAKPSSALAKPSAAPIKPSADSAKPMVMPAESLVATVLVVNAVGHFVILNFPTGQLPKLQQHLFLYRGGLKTAEVKIVGPQRDTSIVANILSGDAQLGDTVRDR